MKSRKTGTCLACMMAGILLVAAPLLAGSGDTVALKPGVVSMRQCRYIETDRQKANGPWIEAPMEPVWYSIYVPTNYNQNTQDYYPCLIYITSGHATREEVASFISDRMKQRQWVVIMIPGVNSYRPLGRVLAVYDDVVMNLGIKEEFMVAEGTTGYSMLVSQLIQVRPGITGLIVGPGHKDQALMDQMSKVRLRPGFLLYTECEVGSHNWEDVERIRRVLPQEILYSYHLRPTNGGPPVWTTDTTLDFFEEWMACGQPMQKKQLPVYIAHALNLLEQARNESSPAFERYEAVNRFLRMVKSRGLKSEKELALAIAQAPLLLKELENLPEVKKEKAAKEAFLKLQSVEEQFRFRVGQTNTSAQRGLSEARAAYEQLATKHAETVYGRRAGEKRNILADELVQTSQKGKGR